MNPSDNGVKCGLNICRGDGGHNGLLVLLKNFIQILPEKQSLSSCVMIFTMFYTLFTIFVTMDPKRVIGVIEIEKVKLRFIHHLKAAWINLPLMFVKIGQYLTKIQLFKTLKSNGSKKSKILRKFKPLKLSIRLAVAGRC